MNRALLLIAFMGLIIMPTGCVTSRGFPETNHIQNFDKVTPTLMRGAQPTEVGFEALASIGVKVDINLRKPDDIWPAEQAVAEKLGIEYHNFPMSGIASPPDYVIDDILEFIALCEKENTPVFVHCQYGCDRTGTVIACYRIRYQKWSNADALREAEQFGMSPLSKPMKSFIKDFK